MGCGGGLGLRAGVDLLFMRTGPGVTFGTADPGAGQILGLVLLDLMVLIALTVACTISAAAGAPDAPVAAAGRIRGRETRAALRVEAEWLTA